jgi:UDP-N-acetylmuramate--alanine ligase
MCIDHPTVRELAGAITDRTILTYGESDDADVRLVDFRHDGKGIGFSVEINDRATGAVERIEDVFLPMPGKHNALNATATIAVARRIGIPAERIVEAFADFAGVKRRFTLTGEWNGVRIYDDYGHHPVEIAAVLKAARGSVDDAGEGGRVIAIMQPHRYTRLSSLFDPFAACFTDADTIFIADVYPAGEDPIEGANRDALVAAITKKGHRDARALPGADTIADEIAAIAKPGDLVIFLGAGSITRWAHALPGDLAKRTEGVSA